MSDVTIDEPALAGPSPWDRVVERLGPMTSGQRWTAALACGATAVFLLSGLAGPRAVVDDTVTGTLQTPGGASAAGPVTAGGSATPAPGSDHSTDAATFFNDPSLGAQPTTTAVDPLAGEPTYTPPDSTSPSDGGGSQSPSGDQAPPTTSAPPPSTPLPLPLPVPIPGLGG